MSTDNSGKEVVQTIEIRCEHCNTWVRVNAYKSDQWTADTPTQNLSCKNCAGVVFEDDLNERLITRSEIEAIVAAMAVAEASEATVAEEVVPEPGTVVETVTAVEFPAPDEVVANVVVVQPEAPAAEPRFCGLCGGPIPPEHKYPLHSSCYGATRVYFAENGVIYTGSGKKKHKVNMEWELESADRWLQGMVGANGDLDFSAATAMFAKATEAYKNGEDLVAVRLAFVAKDMAARPYVDKMYDYLVQQANNLRDESFLTDEIEKMLIRVEEFMGREWYIAAAEVLKGNRQRNQSGAKHAVGKAWQTPRTQQTLKRVEEQLVLLKGEPIEIPAEALELYRQATKQLADNPWEAEEKAQRAKEILEPAVVEADHVRRAQFAAGLTFGARVLANAAPEDLDEFEEFAGGTGGGRDSQTHRRGDGDGPKPKRNQKKKSRGGRRAEKHAAIADSLATGALTVVEPA